MFDYLDQPTDTLMVHSLRSGPTAAGPPGVTPIERIRAGLAAAPPTTAESSSSLPNSSKDAVRVSSCMIKLLSLEVAVAAQFDDEQTRPARPPESGRAGGQPDLVQPISPLTVVVPFWQSPTSAG